MTVIAHTSSINVQIQEPLTVSKESEVDITQGI